VLLARGGLPRARLSPTVTHSFAGAAAAERRYVVQAGKIRGLEVFSCRVVSGGDRSRCRTDRKGRCGAERSLETAGWQVVARAFTTGGALRLARARRRLLAALASGRAREPRLHWPRSRAKRGEDSRGLRHREPRLQPVSSCSLLLRARAAFGAACQLGALLQCGVRVRIHSGSRSLRAHFARVHNKLLQQTAAGFGLLGLSSCPWDPATGFRFADGHVVFLDAAAAEQRYVGRTSNARQRRQRGSPVANVYSR